MLRVWIVFVTLLVFTIDANSGTMVKLRDLNMAPDSHPDPSIGCSHQFSGNIEKGDLAKFAIVEQGQTISVVCLDSPGGSFVEAVRIAKYLKEHTIGTKLNENARCESACSIIFMAGSYYAHEVGALHWRIMHPSAKLGFHVPALTVADGEYDKDSVEKAYKLAMYSMSEIIFSLVSNPEFEGGDSMKSSLLGKMISTPASQMFYIDSVDQAGRWDIMVGPTRELSKITDRHIYFACQNIRNWANDKSAINAGDVTSDYKWIKRVSEHGQTKVNVIVEPFAGVDCDFILKNDPPVRAGDVSLQASVGQPPSRHHIYAGTFLEPDIKLASLASHRSPASRNESEKSGLICAVMKFDALLETDNCTKTNQIVRGKRVTEYRWPSGAKTILMRVGAGFSVNGQKAQPARKVREYTCVLNPKSSNQFCFSEM